MGCTSAKQVSAVPNDEEGRGKAYSNGDLFTDEYKMKGVEEVKYMRGEEDRVNARNQENLVRNKTRAHTHTSGKFFLCSGVHHIFLCILTHTYRLRLICLLLSYTLMVCSEHECRHVWNVGEGNSDNFFPVCHRLSYLDPHNTRQNLRFWCFYMHFFICILIKKFSDIWTYL
uniref:Uncharacterized protein n=1 Tax=Cyprinus carpio TaxID=7962 RepID=A0A8C2AFZ0_CYPCA